MEYLLNIVPAVAAGLQVTLKIFIVTIILSLPLGILMALGRISKIMPLRKFMGAYIYVMRGTPLMLQILFIYYGLPFIIQGLRLPDFPAALIAFVFNYAAYFAEIFRGGIQSIDRGQYEGAKVLGMTYIQTMRRIVLPQVVKRVLPPVANETINLLKDTSLVYILAMNDILRITRSIVQRDFDTTAFIVAAVFYLFFTFILTKIFSYLEKRYAVYDE
ncbi:amino acid ABC transporter permease [Megasphaera cerevisiae DSM 20462]|jgi:polar amino acid transport system permease protein|uniref:Amino acid ABC transporter permease n=1 Tax=Megasphaera cerevisiae DSM 20462 TaxID=1122219 RepID=A0A0J6WZD8_9FIRM|nr:amino acid ABC transporter permease [Megasphaera cerevisiae]KMO87247.1 amino acid ABC transporter permease [Megasphaera cerevisiae DSM 20462]OKY52559.1 amino acid ABC transporter permease [Megasphaera cerevisiae]SJZ50040.1 polar amino acid transport system permease protein [Megasphaera cerevisiae DSM 20462]